MTAATKRPGVKRAQKPVDPETAMQRRVADAALRAVTELATAWPEADYRALRAVTVHALFAAVARARGMQVQGVEALVADGTSGKGAAFFAALDALPFAEITTEQFGAAHEMLSGFRLEGGEIVPSKERRQGGVHFTPRSMVEPIVVRTLEPLFACWDAFGERHPSSPRLRNAKTYHEPFRSKNDDRGLAETGSEALLEAIVKMPRQEQILSLRITDPAVGAGAFPITVVRVLGDLLVASWKAYGNGPETEDRTSFARQLVAIHCVQAVDISPFAVAATKLALTLECRADGMPLHWLDPNIRCGDFLLGAELFALVRFHWASDGRDAKGKSVPVVPELRELVDHAMRDAIALRRTHAHVAVPVITTPAIERTRMVGDLLIGAFFAHDKTKAREQERVTRLVRVLEWLASGKALPDDLVAMRERIAPRRPFHFRLEFADTYSPERIGQEAYAALFDPPARQGKEAA
jgi:hypothetical protein